MKKVNDEFIKLLMEWGDWRACRVRGLASLGYPNTTPENRLLTSPGRAEGKINTPMYYRMGKAIKTDIKLQSLSSRFKNFLWVQYVQVMILDDAIKAMGCQSKVDYSIGNEKAHLEAAKLLNYRYYIYS